MITSKYRVLANNFVAKVTNMIIKNNELWTSYFERIGYLIQFEKSEANNQVRLQDIVSKIDISLTNIYARNISDLYLLQ